MASISGFQLDRTKALATQISSKSYFSGEIAGLRLSQRSGMWDRVCAFLSINHAVAQKELDKPQTQNTPLPEVDAIKARLSKALQEIRAKDSHLTVRDLKHFLFRCAATLISAPKVRELALPRFKIT
jgi:phosphatidylinositol 4-kinase